MAHRLRVLDELEAELELVVASAASAASGQRDARDARESRRRRPTRASRRLALAGAFVLLILAGATIALAATGVILTGAPVAVPASLTPTGGAGLPLPGQSRLLSLRVPDPTGGPPWGMRVVHTTRGLVCVQIGRVEDGQLGELGTDGVYDDDGLFHPLRAGVLPTYAGGAAESGAMSERGSCVLAYGDVSASNEAWGSAVAAEFSGADENAAFESARSGAAAAHRREVAYGILGPHAVSVTYRAANGLRTIPVVPPVGAYLIVQPDRAASRSSEGHGQAPGTDTPGEGPGTVGALAKITYEDHGRRCESGSDAETGGNVNVGHPCPAPNPYPPSLRVTPPGPYERHPSASFTVSHGRVLAATLSFPAPFAVTSAAEEYSLAAEACGPRAEGTGVAVLDRNVARGATVKLTLDYPFSAPCARRSLVVNVLYQAAGPDAKRSYGRAPGELVMGTVELKLPPGDRPASNPLLARRR